MTPPSLTPLLRPLARVIPGIGPKTRQALDRFLPKTLGQKDVATPFDVLAHIPRALIDRRHRPSIRDLRQGDLATLTVTVNNHHPPTRKGGPYRISCSDATGPLTILYFKTFSAGFKGALKTLFPQGQVRVVSGRVDFFNGAPHMAHPDYVLPPEQAALRPLLEPVYPLTAGLGQKSFQTLCQYALSQIPPHGTLPPLLERFFDCLKALHTPQNPGVLDPCSPERLFLAEQEITAHHLTLALSRRTFKKTPCLPFFGQKTFVETVLASLPYALTSDQKHALEEISHDLRSGERMSRLLQGDVGSGKTIVAFLACLEAIESGFQAAIMAPTDLLARQHVETLSPLLALLPELEMTLLTGREKGNARKKALETIATGTASLVIGTHALFQDDVVFQKLGLIVIDEQHRFGVCQRLALQNKAKTAHLLAMSATPIPRTLSLVLYGDMDSSVLKEKPKGRLPILTRVLSIDRLPDLLERLGTAFAHDHRAYWVVPLIEEQETLDLTAAKERFATLQQHFGPLVGLIHGQMKGPEKDRIMGEFQRGALKLLVATTVIEVGVHVPEASIMVIEHAERFGLSQLHQLRGRVGRGTTSSSCLLLYRPPLGKNAYARLEHMRDTEDGFALAEADLTLRGAGDVLGTKQSGLPTFRFFDWEHHGPVLLSTREKLLTTLDDLLAHAPPGEPRLPDGLAGLMALLGYSAPSFSLHLS